MRKGHNYGEQYDFINPLTGFFADEINFKEKYEKIISNREKMDPNLYVMQNRNCKVGTKIMGDVIRKYEISQNRPWRTDLGIKVNDLHGMAYLDNNSSDYDCSYSELKKCVLNVQLND